MNEKETMNKAKLWAGLNKPTLNLEHVDVAVFGIPYDGSVSFRYGAKEGPDAVRAISHAIAPTTEYFEDLSQLKVKDLGDCDGGSREEIFHKVRKRVADLVAGDRRFTMIGGDHSTTIPVLQGIDDALEESFGIIHLDAHFDLCHEIDGDTFSHGATERRALELKNIDGTDSLFFIGIRSIEMDELNFINKNPVQVVNAYEFNQIGVDETLRIVKKQMSKFNKIYLTVDIDCLDPAYAAGTGTPQFGGMSSRQLLDLLKGLFDLPIIGFDVVEVAPSLDGALTSVFAARKIITECWGHWKRKGLLD